MSDLLGKIVVILIFCSGADRQTLNETKLQSEENKYVAIGGPQMDVRQKHILIEKIKLLYLHSLTPAILSGVAAFFLVAALWPTANRRYLLIWFITTLVLAAIRITLLFKFKRSKPVGDAILAWEKPYIVSMMIVFLVWGVGLPIIVPNNDLASIFIVNTFAIGLAAAANSWRSEERRVGKEC